MALISIVSGAVQSDMPPLAQASEREASLPWWAWLLIVMILAWLLVRWLNRRTPRDTEQPTASYPPPSWKSVDSGAAPSARTAPRSSAAAPDAPVEIPTPPDVEPTPATIVEPLPASGAATIVEIPPAPVVEPAPAAIVEPAPAKPDDLTIIEGIGPKISALLVRSGIRTFAELATTDVERLRQILLEVGYRVNDPTTWPEQARLATAGDWDRLKALQDALKGGRRG